MLFMTGNAYWRNPLTRINETLNKRNLTCRTENSPTRAPFHVSLERNASRDLVWEKCTSSPPWTRLYFTHQERTRQPGFVWESVT